MSTSKSNKYVPPEKISAKLVLIAVAFVGFACLVAFLACKAMSGPITY